MPIWWLDKPFPFVLAFSLLSHIDALSRVAR